ncbi:hypothetical protein [Tenacibaculum ovolyticum]|uniref:hypothetical protein n=1 Tax=Tenacibaculum ovolyticum TaxID=104270 RepID=UPI0004144F04|nr:hypothetical protein [Tenacibaculum ovolyticum]
MLFFSLANEKLYAGFIAGLANNIFEDTDMKKVVLIFIPFQIIVDVRFEKCKQS